MNKYMLPYHTSISIYHIWHGAGWKTRSEVQCLPGLLEVRIATTGDGVGGSVDRGTLPGVDVAGTGGHNHR